MSALGLGPLGALGKLPAHGDFLRFGARGPGFEAFDEFLTTNIEWAEARTESAWTQAYPRAAVHAFAFRITEQRDALLTGAIVPSRDRAGRRFPFVVAAEAEPTRAVAAAPELLPLLLEPCWQAASETVVAARTHADYDVSQHLSDVQSVAPEQFADAASSYGEWTQVLETAELVALIFGKSPAFDPVEVFDLVYQTVQPVRGREYPTTRLSLRLPLGRAGGVAACFWLDFVRRTANWQRTIPSFFWSHDGEDGAVLVCLGQAPKSTLHELWSPSGSRDELCDVTRPRAASAPTSRAEFERRRATWQAARSVAELLRAAESFED
jgi:type VI secretion system ImpM family protein